eukprot:6214517-Pleurochrysis_carterae.AAC.3
MVRDADGRDGVALHVLQVDFHLHQWGVTEREAGCCRGRRERMRAETRVPVVAAHIAVVIEARDDVA